jgi:hypothetical protein
MSAVAVVLAAVRPLVGAPVGVSEMAEIIAVGWRSSQSMQTPQ